MAPPESDGRKKSVIELKKHYQQQIIRQLIEKDAEDASQSINLKSQTHSGYNVSWEKSKTDYQTQVMLTNAKLLQKELIDQAQLHKFKDCDKNKKIETKFQKFIELAKDAESVQKLRKKVTHDIEHQINDLNTLRE